MSPAIGAAFVAAFLLSLAVSTVESFLAWWRNRSSRERRAGVAQAIRRQAPIAAKLCLVVGVVCWALPRLSPEMLLALERKVLAIALILATYLIVDRWFLGSFDTAKAIRNDPKAVAGLLGAITLAVALA